MFFFGKGRAGARGQRRAAPDRGTAPLERAADALTAQGAVTQSLLEQAAAALEAMQARCAAAEAELGKLKRARDEASEELLRMDEEATRLEELAEQFRDIAVAQRDGRRRAEAECADKDEQIARLGELLARYLDADRSAVHAGDPDAGMLPPEAVLPSHAETADDYAPASLDQDEDVIRFRKHLEALMAA